MSKEAVLNKIKDVGIVAVIRAESVEQAAKITDACVAGGVTTVELCFTVPNADQLISQMVKKYEGTDVTIGCRYGAGSGHCPDRHSQPCPVYCVAPL